MRITHIHFTPISVPFIEPVPWRYGVAAGVSSVVVQIETDAGIEGLGEAPGEPTVGVVLQALEALRDHLLGQDPRKVRKIVAGFDLAGADHFPFVFNIAVAALEMALMDICGKALNAPIYDLLGGRTNDHLEFYWHVNPADGTPDSAAAAAKAGLARGFRTMYMKGGVDLVRDLLLLESVRAVVGEDVALRIDPNEGWRPVDVWMNMDRLRALRLQFIEQPFPKDDHHSAIRLSAASGILVAANQSAWRLVDLTEVLRRHAADVVVTGIHQSGGVLRFAAAAELCALARIPLVRHSLCDLGIATAAALHVLAAVPGSGLAHQTHLSLFVDDLLESPWQFDGGALTVSRAPGLGVALRPAAVQEFAHHYQEVGEFRGYAPRGGNASSS